MGFEELRNDKSIEVGNISYLGGSNLADSIRRDAQDLRK